MQSELEDHGFDVDGSVDRIRTALRSRGVDVAPNHDTDVAKTFAERAEARYPRRKGENLAAHPFWTHLEQTHGVRQHAPIDGCAVCALLYAWWRPYWLKLRTRIRAKVEAVASSAAQARPLLRAVRAVLPDERGDDGDAQILDFADDILSSYSQLHERSANPEIRRAGRRGRRPYALLRELESVFRRARFEDREVAQLLFGETSANTVRSIRDRRRPYTQNGGLEK